MSVIYTNIHKNTHVKIATEKKILNKIDKTRQVKR